GLMTLVGVRDDAPAPRATFAGAAAQNALLRSALPWSYGGKPQRGWQIYARLISALIGTEREPDHPEFAEALARWQAAQGLIPHGVLETETWSLMVEIWQSRRRYDYAYPPPSQLVTVPSSEF